MAPAKFRIGYWLASTEKSFSPENDSTVPLFTHLYYAFLQVQEGTGELIIPPELEEDMRSFVNCAHDKNKKALVSIGGPKTKTDDPSSAISMMARSADKRNKFVESTLAFAKDFGFDGFELAWEYPKTKNEMRNLSNLFSGWKSSLKSSKDDTKNLLLSIAVYCKPIIPNISSNQEIKYPHELENYVDIFNIILYNYCPVTCQHSQFNPSNPGPNNSSEDSIKSWTTTSGFSTYKLVMGIPLYGQKWILGDQKDISIGAPTIAYVGPVAYKDIPDPEGGIFDKEVTKCMYKADKTTWYGYEATSSITEKVDYANKHLGGYFLYAIGDDDDDRTMCTAAAGIKYYRSHIIVTTKNLTFSHNKICD
ncbi:class V chitinase CHIT5 isoform X1 [Cannabis sativa]|uniref:class V chitinase CHIT5 isoform X1 n=1 Tax=Cannabis sativa TaxID=3483 RepID=UPI0029C9E9A0|nr:class V chitinase CHIT5 isoform X1 [Cannabis sativa]